MPLNFEMLQQMQLTDDAAQQVLAAHREAMDALRAEFDAYRREVDSERVRQARQGVIRDALRSAGANEAAVELLTLAVTTTDADWEGASLRDPAATLRPVQTQYAGFFSRPVPLPTDPLTPPVTTGTLTLADVRAMSPEEINENWSAISSALQHHT